MPNTHVPLWYIGYLDAASLVFISAVKCMHTRWLHSMVLSGNHVSQCRIPSWDSVHWYKAWGTPTDPSFHTSFSASPCPCKNVNLTSNLIVLHRYTISIILFVYILLNLYELSSAWYHYTHSLWSIVLPMINGAWSTIR